MTFKDGHKTTANIVVAGSRKGSGVIFHYAGAIYCATAAHNLYGLKLDQECKSVDVHVLDYQNSSITVSKILGDILISKQYDIALLLLNIAAAAADLPVVLFSGMPESRQVPLLLRGTYGLQKEPVNWKDITFDEKKNGQPSHFYCDIDKQKLINDLFQTGSAWLAGLSGSGLFYDHKEGVILAGILLAIPNDGNDGKLLFCSLEVLVLLGVGIKIFRPRIFELNTDQFSDEWFNRSITAAINALGQRYTPKLNFKLPIAKIFDGLSRNENFKKDLDQDFDKIYSLERRCYNAFAQPFIASQIANLRLLLAGLKQNYLAFDISGINEIPLMDWQDLSLQCCKIIEDASDALYEERYRLEAIKPTKPHDIAPFHNDVHELAELNRAVRAFIDKLESTNVLLANNPGLILKGEAGYGKSHLMADVVSDRQKNGRLSLFLLGQYFATPHNPWTLILQSILLFGGNEQIFLETINAKAELTNNRIILFIDAINEGQGKAIWPTHLKSFIQSVRSFPWLGIVVSVRTSYEQMLVDESIIQQGLVEEITHNGFDDLEYEAADFFFDEYGIKKPAIPFLHPEFRSPLFLKLFCDGLRAKGMREVPPGYAGITAILEFYLDAINVKLAKEFDYANVNLVKSAVEGLAAILSDQGASYMELEKAVYLFNDFEELRLLSNKATFLDALIHEGVLTKGIFYTDDSKPVEGVAFTYERFFDHLVVSGLLKNLGENPIKHFRKKGELFTYFADEQACKDNQGLIEALSIQVPERFDLEFFDLVPHVSDTYSVAIGFIESIIWRTNDSLSRRPLGQSRCQQLARWWREIRTGHPRTEKLDRVFGYLEQVIFRHNGLAGRFLYNLLFVTATPGNIFNADYLHHRFLSMSMADRDATLLPWLNKHYTRGTPIQRLIHWGWQDKNRHYLDDESILLSCTTMGWFLISTHRELRDSATKAMICLLQFRPHLLVQLFEKFLHVNDPYVLERILGVCYGCCMRAKDISFLPNLCKSIFENIFDKEEIYPHLLVRDYAKSIVEFAQSRSVVLEFDAQRAFPPYKSNPITNFPSYKDLRAKYYIASGEPGAHDQNVIFESMNTGSNYGDFGRYVFSNALNDWKVNDMELSHYAIQRIFDMGFDRIRHQKKDHYRYNSSEKNVERTSKKYQWIAMMEILAKVSDHETMYEQGDTFKKTPTPYLGAWQPGVRDIDLSLLIRQTMETESQDWRDNKPWWINTDCMDFAVTNCEWMHKREDIPPVTALISCKDSEGNEWITLELIFDMDEEKKVGEDRFGSPNKRMYLKIRPFLIAKGDFANFNKWAVKLSFDAERMPEVPTKHGIFSREYYWSEAYKYNEGPYFGGNGDEDIYDNITGKWITSAHIPVELFSWEKEIDRSKSSSISFYKPSSKLWHSLGLEQHHLEGMYCNPDGRIDCMDPAVNDNGPSCLLIRKSVLLQFLEENDLVLCWTESGAKQILSSKHAGTDVDPRTSHSIKGFYWLNGGEINGKRNSTIKDF